MGFPTSSPASQVKEPPQAEFYWTKGILNLEQSSHATGRAAIRTVPASAGRGNAHVGHAGWHQLQEQPEKRQAELFFLCWIQTKPSTTKKSWFWLSFDHPSDTKADSFQTPPDGYLPHTWFPGWQVQGPWHRSDPHVTNEPHFKHGHSQWDHGGETPSDPLVLLHRDHRTSRTRSVRGAEIHLQNRTRDAELCIPSFMSYRVWKGRKMPGGSHLCGAGVTPCGNLL